MREGLRSSTVSQRSSTETQRRRDRTDSRNDVKLASDVGLAGNCNKVRNILPDLNTVANPSEFDSDWPFEGGYADDGEPNGTLAENDVEGFVADGSIKPNEVATGREGEIGKDLMQSYLLKKQKFEQEVHGELRNSGAKMIDINVDAPECDESTFSDFCAAGAGEEEMVSEKDTIGAVDQISQQNIVSNLGCAAAACTEHYGPSEAKMGNYSIDLNVGDDSSDLHSKLVLSGSCSENITSTMDSPGDMDIVSHKGNTLEKDKLQIGVKVLRSRVVGSMGSPGDKLDTVDQKTRSSEEDKLQAGGRVLHSRVVGSGLCSENVTCSMESPGDMLDTVNQKTSSQDEDILQVGGKVLRSRVVGSGLCSENVTCIMGSPADRLDTVNQKTSSPEEDRLQVGGKVLRSRVVVAVTREGHTAGCIRRKRATGCQLNDSETRNDESKEHFDGQNKKHKGIPGTLIEEENILLKTVLHGEEAFVEEQKNDESNEFFEGQNKMDNDCLESLSEKEVHADPLNITIEKDETAAKELSNDIDKVLVVVPKKKVGRGRPRKQNGDNVSASPIPLKTVLHGEEAFVEKQKNDESNEFVVGQNKMDNDCLESLSEKEVNAPLNITIEKDETAAKELSNDINKVSPKKKVGRGRPRKQHGDNVSASLMLKDIEIPLENGVKIEGNSQLTDHIDKQQKGELKKRKRGRPKKIDKEMDRKNLNQHDWEGTNKAGERMKKWGSRKLADVTKNPCGKDQVINSLNSVLHVDEAELKGELKIKKGKGNKGANAADNKLMLGGLMKRKRGRPRKINMENDAPEPIPENQEGAVMVKEDAHHFAEGSVRGAQAEVNINLSDTAPQSSLRLKRKRESTGEEASKGKRKLSTKDNLKVKNSSTREEKNVVRQQIVDMLKSAGWTVEYKPRQGKEYADSVYRSPVGKTYWSVTLAYRVLKQQVEMGTAANFCFTPIPDEKLSTLYRIQVKARSDKKPKQNSSDVKSSGKCKGRKKMDSSEGKTANSLSKRKPSSVKSGKQNRRRCALLVRGSGLGINSAAEKFMAISGKHSILSWMIECGVIPSGGKVHYRRRTKVLLEGSITKDGIHCSCCSKLYSVVQFEAHAGNRSCPMYQNLYLDNGSSLLQCQMESWNKQEESIRLGFHKVNVDDNDPNDDTCGICGDGGNLICCDGCPSTFHQACLNIVNFPSGDWHCVYCSCKYCETTTGDVDQVNENHDTSPVLLTCCLCDGKYHHLCAYELEDQCGQSSSSAFCGKTCEQIYERFQRLVGVKAEVGDGYTCTFIKRPESQDITSRSDVLEPKEIENMSKIAIALSVMDECFLPITDHRSGVNLMRHTLYSCGSNFKRLNFRGFFTAILEKEDEIIAAASIRIHGKELAEMPFIGTRNAYRRQGMCRRLLSGIESALSSLAIEKLVIPAVSEVTETWTSVFGFEPLGGLDSEMRHMNIIVFPGVDMLQKPLDQQVVDETTSDREKKDIKSGDCCNKKHAEENGLIETKAEDGCISENCEPSIEPLQDSENGSHAPLEFATVDQEEGSNTERICSDINHTTEENNQLTPTKDEGSPDGASDHMVPVLVERLSLTENDACEDMDETFKSGTTGVIFEDHISRLVEGGPDDTALNKCEGVANKADVTVQPNSSNDCLKLEDEVINPLESGAADPSLNSLCNCYLPTSVNDVNHPVEGTHNSTRPVVQELQVQSLATEEKFLFVTDNSILNGAEAIAKTLEEGSNTERVSSDTTEESNQSTPAKDRGSPDEASDHMILSSEKPVMVENPSLAENDSCEEVLSTVFEDHISRLVKDEHDDTALKGCEGVANRVDDRSLADVRVQPNSCIDHPKLEVEGINPLENGAADPSSNLLCNSDLPSNVNDVYNPVEDSNDSAAKGNLLLVTDHPVLNGAQVTAKTPEHLSDLQNDCNIVTQFNLEKSCNMDSGSNDLGTSVTFHACSAPEV